MPAEAKKEHNLDSTALEKVADFIRGEDAILTRYVPKELQEKHINQVLNRHPYHPYDPEMKPEHPCFDANDMFKQCMDSQDEDSGLHMKHVNCFMPYKTELMKCFANEKKVARLAAAAAEEAAAKGSK